MSSHIAGLEAGDPAGVAQAGGGKLTRLDVSTSAVQPAHHGRQRVGGDVRQVADGRHHGVVQTRPASPAPRRPALATAWWRGPAPPRSCARPDTRCNGGLETGTAEAASGPNRSVPARGWQDKRTRPAGGRQSSMSRTAPPFTLPTSNTSAPGARAGDRVDQPRNAPQRRRNQHRMSALDRFCRHGGGPITKPQGTGLRQAVGAPAEADDLVEQASGPAPQRHRATELADPSTARRPKGRRVGSASVVMRTSSRRAEADSRSRKPIASYTHRR